MTVDQWKAQVLRRWTSARFFSHGEHGWSAHNPAHTMLLGIYAVDFGFCSVGERQFDTAESTPKEQPHGEAP